MKQQHDHWCSSHSSKTCDCTFPARNRIERVVDALKDAYCYGSTTFALAELDAARLVEGVTVHVAREHARIFGHVPVGASVLLKAKFAEHIEKDVEETHKAGGCLDGGLVERYLDVSFPRTVVAHEIYSHVALPASEFPRKVLVTPGVFAGQPTVALDFDDFTALPGDFRPPTLHDAVYGDLFDEHKGIKVCEHSECSDERMRELSNETWPRLQAQGFQKRSLVPMRLPPGKQRPWNDDLFWRCPTCKLWSVKPVMRALADYKREF